MSVLKGSNKLPAFRRLFFRCAFLLRVAVSPRSVAALSVMVSRTCAAGW